MRSQIREEHGFARAWLTADEHGFPVGVDKILKSSSIKSYARRFDLMLVIYILIMGLKAI